MSEEKTTTIVVSMYVWRELMKMRQTPQDSFDTVLRRVLKVIESLDSTPGTESNSNGEE